MLERADPELVDFVRSRARRFREHTVEAAAEYAAEQRETSGSDGPATAARARAADRAAFVEVERDQLAVVFSPLAFRARFAAAGARVEHRVETLEREELP